MYIMNIFFQIFYRPFQPNNNMGRSKDTILAILSICADTKFHSIEFCHNYYFSRYTYAGQLRNILLHFQLQYKDQLA